MRDDVRDDGLLRPGGLLRWQLEGYPRFHGARRNLVIHVLTVPLFWAGSLAIVTAPAAGLGAAPSLGAVLGPALGGLASCVIAVAAQGVGHRGEQNPPIPFRGPLDVVLRILAEQWITFPRWVLGGGLARAWRDSA